MGKTYDELRGVTISRLEGELAEARKENVALQRKVERIRDALDAAGTSGEHSLLIMTIGLILAH